MAGASLGQSGRRPAGGGRCPHSVGLAGRVKPGATAPKAPAYVGSARRSAECLVPTDSRRFWQSRCFSPRSEPSGGEVAGVFPPRHEAAKAFEGHLSAGCSSPTQIRGQETLRTTLRPALTCGNRLSGHLLRGFHLSLLDAIVWNEAGATRSCAASCVPSDDDDVPAGSEWAMRMLRAVGPGRARLHAAPRSPGPAGWAAPAGRIPSEVVCAQLCGQMLGYTE